MGDALSEIFDDPEFRSINLAGAAAAAASPENLFSILETLQDINGDNVLPFSMFEEPIFSPNLIDDRTVVRMTTHDYSNVLNTRRRCETDEEEEDGGAGVLLRRKKMKFAGDDGAVEEGLDGQPKVSHITVERNRRKQMNEHLVVLRSLMPCFYVKRGDQASIIGGVVDYIKELQQLLKSLEAKKQRKAYSEVLSPRPPLSSPRIITPPPPPSPRRPSPLCSPRVCPTTPQPVLMSPNNYKPKAQPCIFLSPAMASSHESDTGMSCADHQLAGNYRSASKVAAGVEVKLSGPNVVLKTASHRIPGQALKIITVLEGLALEILHVSISTMEDAMLFSFTIKIGIECELSAEELAQEIQQTFS